MSQHVQENQDPARVPLGAYVDRRQRDLLTLIAQREDRSVSAIVRLALADYIDKKEQP